MPTCEKEYSLTINPPPTGELIGYWKFDTASPFVSEVNPAEMTMTSISASATSVAGLLNNALRISGIGVSGFCFINGAGFSNDLILENGLTWTTWVNFADFGTAGSVSRVMQINFRNSLNAVVFELDALMLATSPSFIVIQNGGSTFFSPTATYGTGVWNLIRVQFDPVSLKVGVQRANTVFGIGSMEESAPIGGDLSTIVKGDIGLSATRALGNAQDYRQDESGLWNRLLTDDEFSDLFGAGTPPAYPNVPP